MIYRLFFYSLFGALILSVSFNMINMCYIQEMKQTMTTDYAMYSKIVNQMHDRIIQLEN